MSRILFVCIVGSLFLAVAGNSFAGKVIKVAQEGNPQIKSINVISFAPEGVLLIGDGRGSQIVAVETPTLRLLAPGDSVTPDGDVVVGNYKQVSGIDKKLAARIGAQAKGIEIIDMAVNPLSGVAYIAARKQDDKTYLVFTVNSQAKIGIFDIEAVRYTKIQLASGKASISVVTDVAWAGTQVVAAARSSEAFSSKIFSIPAPLGDDTESKAFSAETYHVSHGRWETKAPMSVLIPIRENDQTYVVGAFSCTPVVKYRIDALKPGATVKGSSVIELGSGNRPLDMFVYEKDGKPFVLANTFRFHHSRKPFGPSPYWTVKFEQGLLSGSEDINEKAVRRLESDYKPATDRIEMVEEYHGVTQMDRLGKDHALTLRESKSGLELVRLPLP